MQVPQERLFLDTNILFILISNKHKENNIRTLLEREYSPFNNRKNRTCINDIVIAEIKAMIKYKDCKQPIQYALFEALDKVSKLKIDKNVIEEYVLLRATAYTKKLKIKHNDLWIAATAIVNDCFIITFDGDDFSKIRSISDKLKLHNLSLTEALLGNIKAL